MSLRPTSKSDHRLPSHSSTTAVQIHTDCRFFPRRTPKYVHISSNEIVFTSGSSVFIPRIFLTDAGRPDPAGLRSERSASIIQMDERAFFNPDERGRLVYLHRPTYRRHARPLGVHGERLVYDFGRVAVAVAVGGVSARAVPATVGPLASGSPVLGHPVGAAVGTSHVVSIGALSSHFQPFLCVGLEELYTISVFRNTPDSLSLRAVASY